LYAFLISSMRATCIHQYHITFRDMLSFSGEEFLAPLSTLKPEDHALSAVRDSLFSIFTATLHIRRLANYLLQLNIVPSPTSWCPKRYLPSMFFLLKFSEIQNKNPPYKMIA
jgi:hypothetical protein